MSYWNNCYLIEGNSKLTVLKSFGGPTEYKNVALPLPFSVYIMYFVFSVVHSLRLILFLNGTGVIAKPQNTLQPSRFCKPLHLCNKITLLVTRKHTQQSIIRLIVAQFLLGRIVFNFLKRNRHYKFYIRSRSNPQQACVN